MSPSDDLAALLQHNRWIRDLARSLVADSNQADDLVQDAWVAAVGRPPDTGRSARGWLATVLRRRKGELTRERARRREREQSVARPEAMPSAHDVVERAALQRQIVEAVLELDEPYRTTVLMRFFEEHPPREIARRTGVPVATVQSRLTRGLELLREKLSRGGGPESWLSVLLPFVKEPTLAKATVLGIGAMKLTAIVVLAASVIVGLVLWRRAPTTLEDGRAVSLAARPEPVDVERRNGSHVEDPVSTVELRTAADARAHVESKPPIVSLPAQAHVVRGRVLDALGIGLPGVKLALARKGEDRPAPFAADVTSGSGGWFEVAPSGGADTIVSADERYATVFAGSAGVQGDTQPTVVVAARIDLSGDVVDENGAPLAGAGVELHLPEGFGAEWGLVSDYSRPQRWTARSGEDGRFELAGVPAVLDATLAAALGGYVTRVEPAPCHSDPQLEIVLARPRADAHLIRGVVLDPEGRAVRGARVSARAEVAITNASGEFALDLGSPGTRPPLRALKRGYTPAEFEPEKSGWPAHVVLHLGGPSATIRGRVVDGEHNGVAGARVWLDDATSFGRIGHDLVAVENQLRGDERFWGYVESGADGVFELPGVLQRDYRVKAVVPETLVEGELGHVLAQQSPIEIVLDTRSVHARVAGHVVGRDGRPIAGAAVRLLRITYQVDLDRGHQNDGIERKAVITDADGAFELKSVPKSGVGLLVTGDTILFAGAELKEGTDVEHLRIVAAQRFHLQVELREPVDRADHFRVLDEDGQPLVLNVMQDEGAFFGPEQPLVDGRSAVIALDDGATTLVLLRGGLEVERSRITLSAGVTNVVRP